jgi:hypothetical protein
VGAGRSLEAAYILDGAIGAGSWNFVLDGICLESVDVTFELLLRAGDDDTQLAAFSQHFDPIGGGAYQAQAFEHTEELARVDAADGERLVLRYSGEGSDLVMAWIPNGDGETTGGRIPYLDLPPPPE